MEIKLIIAGSRGFSDQKRLEKEVTQLAETVYADKAVSIVSGMAKGADILGYIFARDNGIVCYQFPADWENIGKRAGYVRNEQMAKFGDALIAFHNGSKGTAHMIDTMLRLGKEVFVSYY